MKSSTLNDCTRFGLFLMVFNTSYKLILCLMRRLGCLNDKVNAPVAGFISALSLGIDVSHRRELLAVLLLSRAIESSLEIAETKKVIPTLKHRNFILWIFANCFIGSCVGIKQGILNGAVKKFYVS